MDGTLDSSVTLVTGSSRGIGAATARELASRGAKVVVNYRTNVTEAETTVADIEDAGGDAMAGGCNGRGCRRSDDWRHRRRLG